MATISIGPGGIALMNPADCQKNTYLADQGNPLGALIETVVEQRMTGMTRMEYPDMAIEMDRHMPMRPVTSERVDGNMTYRTGLGYNGLLNDDSLKNITPSTAAYNNPVQLRTACGDERDKDIASRANTNSEACNPVIDGPMPIVGREQFGRQAFVSRMPIPPLCFQDYVNKENFLRHLTALMDLVNNATMARFAAGTARWLISKTRFIAAPYQVSTGGGNAKLPVSADLFQSFSLPRLPTHWGSFDWISGMLRVSEIPRRQNLTVHLPVAIFKKYKLQYISNSIGMTIFDQTKNLTAAINGYITSIQNETVVYQDEQTGRNITFVATTEPLYIEVKESLEDGGTWRFQEPWILRDSETAGQVMPRENPNYGVACQCPDSTLAALVFVSADGASPFHKEPLPGGNPDAGINAMIDRFSAGSGAKVNTTLAQMYPSSIETRLFTGLEAQVYMLSPINQSFRDAGYACDVASNVEGTWLGGYTKVAAQFVEDDPRKLVAFVLRVPPNDECVELSVPCSDAAVIPEGGAFEPELDELVKQTVVIPEPEEPEAPQAGTIFMIGKSSTAVAPCDGADDKILYIRFERKGGTTGAISANIAGTPSAHVGTIPGTIDFADGEKVAFLEIPIEPWSCTTDTQETESFVLTVSGGEYDADAITERTICVKCNPACPSACEGNVGGCASC